MLYFMANCLAYNIPTTTPGGVTYYRCVWVGSLVCGCCCMRVELSYKATGSSSVCASCTSLRATSLHRRGWSYMCTGTTTIIVRISIKWVVVFIFCLHFDSSSRVGEEKKSGRVGVASFFFAGYKKNDENEYI